MGSYSEEPAFKTITVKEVHPTFAAEVEGVDWKNLSDEQFREIFAAMAKVRYAHISHSFSYQVSSTPGSFSCYYPYVVCKMLLIHLKVWCNHVSQHWP